MIPPTFRSSVISILDSASILLTKVETPLIRRLPVILILPDPLIVLEFRSKLPPSCGVSSSIISELDPAVIVQIPPESADTVRLDPKLTVAAVPTAESLSLTSIPDPTAVIPVSPEPSPTNDDAVTLPAERSSVMLLPTTKLPSSTLTVPLPPPPFSETPEEEAEPPSIVSPSPFPRKIFGRDVCSPPPMRYIDPARELSFPVEENENAS